MEEKETKQTEAQEYIISEEGEEIPVSADAMIAVSILEAYFSTRRPDSPEDPGMKEYKPEHKSTADIIEELSDMIDLKPSVLRLYMFSRRYRFTTGEDGCVRWAIWRRMLL